MENNWIFIGIAIFLVFDFFLVAWIFWRKRKQKGFSADQQEYIRSHWIRILDMSQNNPNAAVLDADKLLDYALARKGFQGTLGEKLKKAKNRFSDINGIWTAHKLRNKIAHELSQVSLSEAKSALQKFKKGLQDLGANL